jgi:hypothetical protein
MADQTSTAERLKGGPTEIAQRNDWLRDHITASANPADPFQATRPDHHAR